MPTVCVEGTRLDMISPNVKIKTTNKSGVTGVHFEKFIQKWRACITFKGKFDRFEEAVQARKNAEDKYFKPILNKYNQE